MSPGIDVEELVLLIDRNAVQRIQSGVRTNKSANRQILALRGLRINVNLGRKFNRRVEFLPCLVNREVVHAMNRVEHSLRRNVAVGFVREHDHPVADIGLDRVHVAILRVDVEAVVELDLRLVARDHALLFGKLLADRSVVGSLEYAGRPEIVVLKNNLIVQQVQPDGAVRGVGIPNRPLRFQRSIRTGCSGARSGSVLRPGGLL